jgi:hypothetical protein
LLQKHDLPYCVDYITLASVKNQRTDFHRLVRCNILGEITVKKFIFVALMILSYGIQADDTETLTVDRSVSQNIEFSFPNNKNIMPKAGDFEIRNYVLMSNEAGERWSVITLTNLSSGTRALDKEHLLALFADGSRSNPLTHNLTFKGKETKTVTVSFGESKFPILSIYSKN